MFDLDVGVVKPFQIMENTASGLPLDLSSAASVDLVLSEATLPLTVTSAQQGLCEFTYAGNLSAGVKKSNIRVRYDAQHVYHSPTILFHVKALAT